MLAIGRSQISCADALSGAECNEQAREMFQPLLTETEHVFSDLNCNGALSVSTAKPRLPGDAANASLARTEATIVASEAKTSEAVVVQTPLAPAAENRNRVEQGKAAPSPAISSTPSNAARVDTRQEFTSTAASGPIGANAKPATSSVESIQRQPQPPQVGRAPAQEDADGADLSNALKAFADASTRTCDARWFSRSIKTDLYAPIRTKICDQREQLQQAKNCFRDAMAQIAADPNQCDEKVSKKIICTNDEFELVLKRENLLDLWGNCSLCVRSNFYKSNSFFFD